MKGSFEKTYLVDGSLLRESGGVRSSRVLAIFQELADKHAELLGCAYADMLKKGLLWVLTSVSYKLVGELKLGDELRAETRPQAPKGIRYRRDFAFFVGDKKVLVGTSEWVFIDVENRRLTRYADAYPADLVVEEPFWGENLKKLPKFEEFCEQLEVIPTVDDIDRNEHVNNVHYVIFGERALKRVPPHTEFQIDFIKESYLGDKLTVLSKLEETAAVAEGQKNNETIFRMQIK